MLRPANQNAALRAKSPKANAWQSPLARGKPISLCGSRFFRSNQGRNEKKGNARIATATPKSLARTAVSVKSTNVEAVGPRSDRLIRLLVVIKSEEQRKHAEQRIEILPEIDDSRFSHSHSSIPPFRRQLPTPASAATSSPPAGSTLSAACSV